MEIKQFYIYKLKNDSTVIVVQNNMANQQSGLVVVILCENGRFKTVDTVNKECFIEEVGKITEEEIKSAKEFYQSVIM